MAPRVELDEGTSAAPAPEFDELEVGRPPRGPLPRLVTIGGAVVAALVVAVAATVFAVTRGDDPAPAATPTTRSSTSPNGFAQGPVLMEIDGEPALQSPSLPGLGSTPRPVPLVPAPDLVAIAAKSLPGLREVRGGEVSTPDRYGFYLAGVYDAAGGPTEVTLYSARATGTTYGADTFVSRSRFDRTFTVRTDVSVFNGEGWWVHAVTTGRDDTGRGEADRLVPLASDTALTR